MELKIGNYYYLCDMSYSTYKGDKDTYWKNYNKFTTEPLKLIEMGKYKNNEKRYLTREDPIYNNVKLLHEQSGIILYSNFEFLRENKRNFIDYKTSLGYNVLCHYLNIPINIDWGGHLEGSFNNRKVKSLKEAKNEEFKVDKLPTEKKVTLLLYKLEDLINRSLENNDKNKFNLYTSRYNKIKNKYCQLIK